MMPPSRYWAALVLAAALRGQEVKFTAEVKVVTLFATARGPDGRLVPDLRQEEFRLVRNSVLFATSRPTPMPNPSPPVFTQGAQDQRRLGFSTMSRLSRGGPADGRRGYWPSSSFTSAGAS